MFKHLFFIFAITTPIIELNRRMNIEVDSLNQLLVAIAETSNKLRFLKYNDPLYDDYETRLHLLEDQLMETYGDYLEVSLQSLYHQFALDDEILHPISYIPRQYEIKEKDGQLHFEVLPEFCLKVNSNNYPQEIVKVVLLPSPARFIVYLLHTHKELVWKVS